MATNTIKSTTSLKYYLCSVSVIHEAKHFTNNNTSRSAFKTYTMNGLLRFCTFFINHIFLFFILNLYPHGIYGTHWITRHIISLILPFFLFFLCIIYTHLPWYVVFMFNLWMLLLNNVNNDTQTRIIYITSVVFLFLPHLNIKNYQDSRL